MMQKYAFEEKKYNKNTMAKAKLLYQNISTKDSIEIAKAIRGKSLEKSLEMLKRVVEKKQPVKYTRFIQESAGHKPGIGSGKYPVKAAEVFIILLELVKNNAEQKSLDEEKLFIIHVKADKASRPWRYGRHRGRKSKRTHLEIVVEEKETDKKSDEKKDKKAVKEKSKSKSKDNKNADKKKSESKAEKKSDSKEEGKKENKVEFKEDKKEENKKVKKEVSEKEDNKENKKSEEKNADKNNNKNNDNAQNQNEEEKSQ